MDNSLNIWFKADVVPFEVKIYADKYATKYFQRRELPTQKVIALGQNGTMEFSLTITDEMEIIPLIKSWLPHLKILEPKWIRDIINEDLEDYLNTRK